MEPLKFPLADLIDQLREELPRFAEMKIVEYPISTTRWNRVVEIASAIARESGNVKYHWFAGVANDVETKAKNIAIFLSGDGHIPNDGYYYEYEDEWEYRARLHERIWHLHEVVQMGFGAYMAGLADGEEIGIAICQGRPFTDPR